MGKDDDVEAPQDGILKFFTDLNTICEDYGLHPVIERQGGSDQYATVRAKIGPRSWSATRARHAQEVRDLPLDIGDR